jgi:hypothetical protein
MRESPNLATLNISKSDLKRLSMKPKDIFLTISLQGNFTYTVNYFIEITITDFLSLD